MTHRILLADDSVTIRKVVELTFSDDDFVIDSVGDGAQALEHARAERPDIVVSDVIMPGLNGYELCQRIKSDPELRSIPFLFLKGTFESFDEEKSHSCGADGFIVKPFESQELISRVKELIERAALASATTQPRAIPRWETPSAAPVHPAAGAATTPITAPAQAVPVPVTPATAAAVAAVSSITPPTPAQQLQAPPIATASSTPPVLPSSAPPAAAAPPVTTLRPPPPPPPVPAPRQAPTPPAIPTLPSRPAPLPPTIPPAIVRPAPPLPERPVRPVAVPSTPAVQAAPPLSPAPTSQPPAAETIAAPPTVTVPPPAVHLGAEDFTFEFGEPAGERSDTVAPQPSLQRPVVPIPDLSGETEEDLWSEVSLRNPATDHLEAPSLAAATDRSGAGIMELARESEAATDEAVFKEVSTARMIQPSAPLREAAAEPGAFPVEDAVATRQLQTSAGTPAIDPTEIERLVAARLEVVVKQLLDPVVKELARAMIEEVAWEVIPELAEAMIRSEIERISRSTRTD